MHGVGDRTQFIIKEASAALAHGRASLFRKLGRRVPKRCPEKNIAQTAFVQTEAGLDEMTAFSEYVLYRARATYKITPCTWPL